MAVSRISRRRVLGALATIPAITRAYGVAPANALAAYPDKAALTILNERPLNAETPPHLLDDTTTPTANLFVRNNGIIPDGNAEQWQLLIGGESCLRPQTLSLTDLKAKFRHYSYDLQLECGGNGRAEFRPRTSGNQWSTGAIGCPRWTGVRVKDVLEYCGLRDDAQYLGYVGADKHLSGDPDKVVISRGVPMWKALEAESLIAFELNGEPIPPLHGAPLRLVCGGWPGSVSGKWLTQLLVRDREHDGAKMGGHSYRVPCTPIAPGDDVETQNLCIIESMPVKSLITYPRSGVTLSRSNRQVVRGHAWAGDLAVSCVQISVDYGQTWQRAELSSPVNRLAWQQWQSTVQFPRTGYYEIWARATDTQGRTQPMLVPGWNPKGYLNNATHRIAVRVV